MFCPRCGANQLAAPPPAAADDERAPPARTSGFADRLRALCGPLAAGFDGAAPGRDDYPPIAYESIDEDHPVPYSRLPLLACSALAIGLFVLAAYVILPRGAWEPIPGVHVIEGTVGAFAQMSPSAPAARTDASREAAWNSPGLGGDEALAPKANANAYVNGRADVARQLAIARASLDRNSLWPAHRAIANVLAAQPDNDDAQQMRADLVARERARNALLADARRCTRSAQWGCVRQSARRAAGIDTSSREARRLLARAAAGQGAGAARYGSPSVLDRLQRWLEQRSSGQTPVKRTPAQLQSWDHP